MAEAFDPAKTAIGGSSSRWTMQLSDDVTALDPILRTPEQISGYGLVKRRGRGGVAEVWEADSPAGYRVALKLVHLSTDLRSGELHAQIGRASCRERV